MRVNPRILAVLCLLLAAACAPAATRSQFDAVVDFSLSLKDVAEAAKSGAPLPANRLLILDGTVSDIAVLDREEGTFRARIELLSGEWIGTEEVRSYSCWVEFSGPGFAKSFPARPPAGRAADVIASGSRLLVVARPLRLAAASQGGARMLMEGLYFRVIR